MIDILEDRFNKHLSSTLSWGEREQVVFKIHNQDVLDFIPDFQTYSVIANIPYYITSPILRHFLYDLENKPDNMIILMQKDVGDKILGKWKSKSSVLSLMIEKKCHVTEEIFVWKENFIPVPKIESSVLKFTVHGKYNEIDDEKFLEIIKIWFSSPRKKLIKNLVVWWYSKDIVLKYIAEIWSNENLRGEDLSIWEWCTLVNCL